MFKLSRLIAAFAVLAVGLAAPSGVSAGKTGSTAFLGVGPPIKVEPGDVFEIAAAYVGPQGSVCEFEVDGWVRLFSDYASRVKVKFPWDWISDETALIAQIPVGAKSTDMASADLVFRPAPESCSRDEVASARFRASIHHFSADGAHKGTSILNIETANPDVLH